MFFWVQNGLLTPRVPEVARPTVRPVMNLGEIHKANPFDPETEPPLEANASHIFQNPRTAYEGEKLEAESPPSPLLFASQIMSSPVTTLPMDAKVEEAKMLFLDKRFRHIPILGHRQQLVGIISDRDVLKTFSASESYSNLTVSEIMVEKVLTGNLQTEIRFAAKVMLDEKVGALPIVDPTSEVIGIITRTDLIRAMVKFPGFTLLA
jgi:acetoin utilization protein AcuB